MQEPETLKAFMERESLSSDWAKKAAEWARQAAIEEELTKQEIEALHRIGARRKKKVSINVSVKAEIKSIEEIKRTIRSITSVSGCGNYVSLVVEALSKAAGMSVDDYEIGVASEFGTGGYEYFLNQLVKLYCDSRDYFQMTAQYEGATGRAYPIPFTFSPDVAKLHQIYKAQELKPEERQEKIDKMMSFIALTVASLDDFE